VQFLLYCFLGLANYYRKFVDHFAELALPLTDMLRSSGNSLEGWNDACDTAFADLKAAITSAPCLVLPDPTKPYFLFTDASEFAMGAVLCQEHGGQLHPIAFESKKLSPAEKNYTTHEKELLAGVHALKRWRHYLEGVNFQWFTDNYSLQFLRTQPMLTRRQARWMELLAGYDFEVKHVPGKLNTPADALSRRPDHMTVDDFSRSLNRLTTLVLQQGGEFLDHISD